LQAALIEQWMQFGFIYGVMVASAGRWAAANAPLRSVASTPHSPGAAVKRPWSFPP
jgi:hypothetical protein